MYKGEINLLPAPLRAKRVAKAYLNSVNRLFGRLWVLLLLVVLAEGAIFLVVRSVDNSFSRNNDQALEAGVDVEEMAIVTNKFLDEFNERLNNSILWTDLLDDVFKIMPDSVILQEVSSDGDKSLVVVGESARRSDMIDFQKKLESLEWVDNVNAPLSNFTVGSDRSFEFKVFIKEKI